MGRGFLSLSLFTYGNFSCFANTLATGNMASVSVNGLAFCSASSRTVTKKGFRMKVEVTPVDDLVRMRSLLPNSQSKEFYRKYGDILDLLDIPVQSEGISALAQFWDNELRCFALPHFHLSLVVEEYASFLKRPLNQGDMVYTYSGALPSYRAVAQLLGKTMEEIPFVKQGQTQALRLAYLVKYMERLASEESWSMFKRVLALTIYGVVLFPFATGSVDMAAISVFMAIEYHRVNPIPAILADTYTSLSFCQQNGGGKLKCCLQLLTVWLGNHIFGKEWSNGVRLETANHPLRDFVRREGSVMKDPRGREGLVASDFRSWADFLDRLTPEKIRWKLVWWDETEVLYSCGEFKNVPLIGPRGAINYNPSLSHLQLAYTQQPPMKELIQPIFFMHGHENSAINIRVTKAWKDIRFKGKVELGPRLIKAAPEYMEWVAKRGAIETIPDFAPPNPLLGNDAREIERTLKFKIEEHKTELENLEVVKKRKRAEVLKSKGEYVELRKEIAELQRVRQSQDPGRIKELQGEVERLESEIKEMHNARRMRDAEFLKEREEYRRTRLELQATKQALIEKNNHLEKHTDRLNSMEGELLTQSKRIAVLQAENDRNLCERGGLHMELDTMKQRLKEMQVVRDCWREVSYMYSDKHNETVEFINTMVPTFIDTVEIAERHVSVFNTPKEIEELLGLCRKMVDKWNVISRVG